MGESEGKADFISHLIEGNNAMVRNDLEAAVAAYHMALALNPKFAMTCTKLGQAYYKKKDYDEAITYYKMALELDPNQTETLYRLGKAYGESGMMIQAAVAFDMAREQDKEGDLAERIDSSERRIKRSSSHSMRKFSTFEILRDTASILINHPSVIIPVVFSVFVFALSSFATRWALAAFSMPAPVIDFTKYLFGEAPKLSLSTVIYLAVLFFIFSFICVPLLNIETALVGRLNGGREATFDEALSRSFGQTSSLAGVTIIILILAGITAIASSYVYLSFTKMFHDFFMFNNKPLYIPFRIFVVPTTVVVMAHFLYIYPSIVMDRKKMESGLKKSIAFASKHYWFTFVFLCCYIGIHFLAIHYSGEGMTPKYVAAQIFLVLAQVFFVAGITTAYTKAQRPKQRKRRRKAQQPSEEEYSEQDSGVATEPIEIGEHSEQMDEHGNEQEFA